MEENIETKVNETPVELVKMEATSVEPIKSIEQLADEVMVGMHGSGRERMIVLGDQYEKVQKEVNRRIREGVNK
jgi:hypothetical protein